MASPTPVPLLWVLNNDLPPYAVEVHHAPFTMGRHSSNHLPLRHAAVSRHHCQMTHFSKSTTPPLHKQMYDKGGF